MPRTDGARRAAALAAATALVVGPWTLAGPPAEAAVTDHFAGQDTSVETTVGAFNGVYSPTSRVTWSTASAHTGTHSLRYASTASGAADTGECYKGKAISSLVAGVAYDAGAWVRSSVAGQKVRLLLRELAPSGATVGSTSATVTVADTAWHHVTAARTATSSGDGLKLCAYAASAPAGINVYVDDWSLVSGAPGDPTSISLPARGTFYYPWFPEAWSQGGFDPATHYSPTLGRYSTVGVLPQQVAAMRYGRFDFAVSSWWGQGTKEDARLQPLLTAAHGTPLRVAPYYEGEGATTAAVPGSPAPAPSQITKDLDYLAAHYVHDPSYLWIAGQPVIFAYGDGSDTCATATRWAQADAAATMHFYVVLKVLAGYASCADQPANWHQYGPATPTDDQGTHSYSISPGFWHFAEATPRLARDAARWHDEVAAMNCSSAGLRLVTTFNEWGEGTSVESAQQWASASGQGTYLDELHASSTCPAGIAGTGGTASGPAPR
ncbi:MAG: hypothetical protein ACJ74O_00235 [Frankiaceae bacterium]